MSERPADQGPQPEETKQARARRESPEQGKYDEREIDEAIADTFPASDPPWWTPGKV